MNSRPCGIARDELTGSRALGELRRDEGERLVGARACAWTDLGARPVSRVAPGRCGGGVERQTRLRRLPERVRVMLLGRARLGRLTAERLDPADGGEDARQRRDAGNAGGGRGGSDERPVGPRGAAETACSMTRSTRPARISSTMLSGPSLTLATHCHGIPARSSTPAVPPVARSRKPRSASRFAGKHDRTLVAVGDADEHRARRRGVPRRDHRLGQGHARYPRRSP